MFDAVSVCARPRRALRQTRVPAETSERGPEARVQTSPHARQMRTQDCTEHAVQGNVRKDCGA